MLKVGVVALDSVKIKARANSGRNRNLEGIEKSIKKMLQEAEKVDSAEDKRFGSNRGDELPQSLRCREERKKRLEACKVRLEEEIAEEEARENEIVRRPRKEASDREKKCCKHKPKVRKPKREHARANTTDPDSRVMKTTSGYLQGYNNQAVANENQIIIAAEISNQSNDKPQLLPMLNASCAEIEKLLSDEKIEVMLADAGYYTKDNFEQVKEHSTELHVAVKRGRKQYKEMKESASPRGRIPNSLTETERMERKLKTKRGKSLYKKRGGIIEPIFGQIKSR